MKGVILAGGKGTRLYPLTYATNKHLLPIYDQPMIYYPIQTLINAGITEVLIVTGESHAGDFMGVIKNGKEIGLTHVEYAYQEGGSAGISDALKYAEDFADGGSIAVILGDNTTDADINGAVKSFTGGAKVFLKEVVDPKRFGIPRFNTDNPQLIDEILRNQTTLPPTWPSLGSISTTTRSLTKSDRSSLLDGRAGSD